MLFVYEIQIRFFFTTEHKCKKITASSVFVSFVFLTCYANIKQVLYIFLFSTFRSLTTVGKIFFFVFLQLLLS